MIIQDEMPRVAVARTLQIEEADITKKKLEELTTLPVKSSEIVSLEGLQYAVNLKYLDLYGNAIEDLTLIRDLREIGVLSLSRNMLRNIQVLREFWQLLRLDISCNNPYTIDISASISMINPEELNLERSKVDNLVYLENVKKSKKLYVGIESEPFPLSILGMLEELRELHMNKMWLYDIADPTYLKHTEVSDASANLFCDLSPLQYMKDSLRNLNISNREYLRDLSILGEFPNLEVPDISFGRIEGFSFLKKLKDLKDLRATQNGLCDLRNLKGLIRIGRLDISENRAEYTEISKEMKLFRHFKASCYFLKDIDFLKNAKDLVRLDISNNHTRHIEALKGCERMTILDIGNSDIRSTGSLEDMTNLECLGLFHNSTSDLTPLKDLTNLSTTGLYNNVITDLSPLKKLISLSSLQLGYNGVMDLSPLEECIYLSSLTLEMNYVTDVTLPTRLRNLCELRLNGNPAEDITALEGMEYYEKFLY